MILNLFCEVLNGDRTTADRVSKSTDSSGRIAPGERVQVCDRQGVGDEELGIRTCRAVAPGIESLAAGLTSVHGSV